MIPAKEKALDIYEYCHGNRDQAVKAALFMVDEILDAIRSVIGAINCMNNDVVNYWLEVRAELNKLTDTP